jgi:hypothetical protein
MSPGKFLKSSIKIRGSFKKILKIKNLFPLLFVILLKRWTNFWDLTFLIIFSQTQIITLIHTDTKRPKDHTCWRVFIVFIQIINECSGFNCFFTVFCGRFSDTIRCLKLIWKKLFIKIHLIFFINFRIYFHLFLCQETK